MSKNSFQKTTKNGKPIIVGGLPLFTTTVESRIAKVKKELLQGVSKIDAIWDNIRVDVSLIKS